MWSRRPWERDDDLFRFARRGSSPDIATAGPAPGMEWSLTTDLDDWTAVTLLGRPPEEVEGITINGAEWETASDDRGPFLRPEELFDDERFLTVLMKFGPDDDYDQAWCFDRAGPLCQLWTYAWSESGEEDHVIYEPDDVAAVERFADLLEGESVAQVTGDLVERARCGRTGPAHGCSKVLGP